MRSRTLVALATIGLVVASCGSDDGGDSGDTSAAPAEAPATDAETAETTAGDTTADGTAAGDASDSGAEPPVVVASSDLGDVLVDAGGYVLYGFTPDAGGVPTCEDACADAWPPVVTESAELPPGLDPAIFSVAERSDGTFQLVAGEWPLYRFAGDVSAGDTAGQNSGGVWFVVAPDGTLIM